MTPAEARARELMFRWVERLSPRPMVRQADPADAPAVDADTPETDGPPAETRWRNHYGSSAAVGQVEPGRPVAMLLTRSKRGASWKTTGILVFLVFDLDAKRVGAEQVAVDEELLRSFLESCGITVVAATSGPSGGRHLWASCPEGLPWDVVGRIAAAAKVLAPSLDWAATMKERWNAAARPPGSPHRDGGWVRLDAEHDDEVEAAITAMETGTRRAAFRLLADRLEAEVAQREPGDCVTIPAPRSPETAPRFELVTAGDMVVNISRTRSLSLPPRTLAALNREMDPYDDHSAHGGRAMALLIFAGYSEADVQALAVTAPGLEYLRSERVAAGQPTRVQLSDAERTAMCARQYDRIARFVAKLAPPVESGMDVGPADEMRLLTEVAVGVALEMMQAEEVGRWGGKWRPSGPADYAVLSHMLTTMLITGQSDLEMPTRALSRATGRHHDTAASALRRLSLDEYLARSAEAQGPHGARYRLSDMIMTEALSRVAVLYERISEAASSAHDAITETEEPQVIDMIAAEPRPGTGAPTQGDPPPAPEGGEGVSGAFGSRSLRTVIYGQDVNRAGGAEDEGGDWLPSGVWSHDWTQEGWDSSTQDHARRDQDQLLPAGTRALLGRRVEILRADLFAHGTGQDGFGRHCAYTLVELVEYGEREHSGIESWELAERTGLTEATTERHLQALQTRGLTGYSPFDGGWFATGIMPSELEDQGRGQGTAARRAEAHRIDAIRWAWWRSEVGFLGLSRDGKRAAINDGKRGSAWQAQLDGTDADVFCALQYPRRTVTTTGEDGRTRTERRPDHAEAANIIRWHLHQEVAEADGTSAVPAPRPPARVEDTPTWSPGDPSAAPDWAAA